MDTYQVLYWVYFFLSAFSLGTMGFAGFLNAVAIKQFKLGFNSIAFYRVLMSAGYIGTIGTLLWTTLPAMEEGIPPSVAYWFFIAGLLLASLGAFGLSMKNIDVHVRMEYKQADIELEGSMSEETLTFKEEGDTHGEDEDKEEPKAS